MSDESAQRSAVSSVTALSDSQKKYLLSLARKSIAATLAPDKVSRQEEQVTSPELQALSEVLAGVFVSLHINDSLRGCIGYIEGLRPLPEVIQETAIAAALRDPRFEPLREDELQEIEIEISVLSPLEQIQGPQDITIGKHGLLVRHGKQQGLLLPQVATHTGWEAQAFLEHTCIKAGLPSNTWELPETEIFRFSAEVFAEKSSS